MKINHLILAFLLSCFLIMSYGFDADMNNSTQETKLQTAKEYFLRTYYWDMPEDSVFSSVYHSFKYRAFDFLVFDYRHYTGQWGKQEFRLKDDKLYELIYQWNGRSEHGLSRIMSSVTRKNLVSVSDSSFYINDHEILVIQLFDRVKYPPYRVEFEWNLKTYVLREILEKDLNDEDSYNYYEVFIKHQHEDISRNNVNLDHHFIFGNTKDSIMSYQKSIGHKKPIYQGYNNIIYPNNKLYNIKGSIEFRFNNQQLVKISEQWSGFDERDLEKIDILSLNPAFGRQINQMEITNQDLMRVVNDNVISFSTKLDIGRYTIRVKKVLLESNFFNIKQNFTQKTLNRKIVNYEIYKEYDLCEK